MIKETARIVAAYLAGNRLAEQEIPDFIRSTYQALTAVSQGELAPEIERAQPAVPVKKSVTPAAVICLECGKKLSMLKRHLRADHNISTDDYRAKWGLPSSYPMVAPEYATRRSALAVKIGLGHSRKKPATGAPPAAKKPARARKA